MGNVWNCERLNLGEYECSFNKHPLFQFHIECFFIVHFLGNSTIFKIIFTDYIFITSPSLNIFNKGYIQ